MLEQLTQVRIRSGIPTNASRPMKDYIYNHWSTSSPHEFAKLLPRAAFEKWFNALFFRLALPFNIDLSRVNNHTIRMVLSSSLNLSVLYRLIQHLVGIGYPSHWLSNALETLLDNDVQSNARPPRQSPVTVEDVRRQHPTMKLSTAPFLHEMGTLAQLFQPLLPFELTSKNVPRLENIYKHTFRIMGYLEDKPRDNNLALLFVSSRRLDAFNIPTNLNFCQNMRPFLDPTWGEKDTEFQGKEFEDFREHGIMLWTAFKFDLKSHEASVWMSENLVEMFTRDEWAVSLVRIDTWTLVARECRVSEAVSRGKRFPQSYDA